jgi:hypothetical protein
LAHSNADAAMSSRRGLLNQLVRFAKSWLVRPPNSPQMDLAIDIFSSFARLARGLN